MKTFAAVSIAVLCLAASASGAAPALNVTPTTVKRGSVVTVSGNVGGGCTQGDSVTIYSRAFNHRHDFAGLPAIFARVGAGGDFSKQARIPASKRAGTYSIGGRCGGGTLGVSAKLTVTR